MNTFLLSHTLKKLEQRVTLIEESVFRKVKRLRATEAQRFLILYHMKMIDPILDFCESQNQKDKFLSVLIDIDPVNAKKFLIETSRKDRPLLETISNYTFLSEFFSQKGYEKIALAVDKKLSSIRADKEKTR